MDHGELESLAREGLLERLRERIAQMLEQDPKSLVSAMYRLDVGERQVAQAFEDKDRERGARALAQAVLDRENRRRESRNRSRLP